MKKSDEIFEKYLKAHDEFVKAQEKLASQPPGFFPKELIDDLNNKAYILKDCFTEYHKSNES